MSQACVPASFPVSGLGDSEVIALCACVQSLLPFFDRDLMTFRRLPLSPEPHLPECHPCRSGLCWGADVDVQHTFSLEEQLGRVCTEGFLEKAMPDWVLGSG